MHSTIYDKDLKQRVFQVRDSERYTNSTQTSLAVATDNDNMNYIILTLTATVLNNEGTSSIAFYDNGTLLGTVDCIQGTTPDSLTAYVLYGEHKLYAKYLGNGQCLSSKSPIEVINIDEPNFIHSSITLESPQEYYYADVIVGQFITGILKDDDNDTVLTGKRVNYYIDDEYVAYATTNSSGKFVCQISSEYETPLGEHTFKAVYAGENTGGEDGIFGCTVEHTYVMLESAMVIEVVPREPIYCVTDTAYFDVTAYWAEDSTPVANEEFWITYGLETLDTQYTDSDGKVTLSALLENSGSIGFMINTTGHYKFVSITVYSPNLSVEGYDYYTSTGLSDIIPFKAVNGSNVPLANCPITIGGDTYVTGSDGIVNYEYIGTGNGYTTIQATSGNNSITANLMDTLMFYSTATDKNYNLSYGLGNSLSLIETNIGLRLTSTQDNNGLFYLNYLGSTEEEWSFQFKVVGSLANAKITSNNIEISYGIISKRPTVTIQKDSNDLITVYINNEKLLSKPISPARVYPHLVIGGEVIIDNLILTKGLLRS